MVDFNTKKNILQKLRKARGENKLLWLPCVIAAAFVKLWYGTVCRIGMALSDRNGNFLGMKMPQRQPKSRRQDDIVYVKKPFIGRVLSAVLAAAFVLMVAPELNLVDLGVRASAADDDIKTGEMIDGIQYVYYIGEPNFLYKENELNAALNYTVKKVTYTPSNRAIKINWESDDQKNISRYHIELRLNGTTVNNGTAGEYEVNTATEHICRNGVNNTNILENAQYEIKITPETKVQRYILVHDDAYPDDPTKKIASPYDEIPIPSKKPTDTPVAYLLNLALTKPVINEIKDDVPSISWSASSLTGADNGSTIMYRLYRGEYQRSGEPTNWVQVTNIDTTSIANDSGTKKGYHYVYFVEAYKVVWTSLNGTREIISSCGNANASIGDKYKMYNKSPYPSEIAELYMSPSKPSVNAEGRNNQITVNWKIPNGTTADKVRVFRSDSEIADQMWKDAGKNSLTEYLLDLYENSALKENGVVDYGEMELNSSIVDSSTSKYPVSVDHIYWYYVIPFVEKVGTTATLYGETGRKSAGISVGIQNERPAFTKVEEKDGEIDLEWTPISGAKGYTLTIKKLTDYNGNKLTNTEDYTETIDVKNATKYQHIRFKGVKLLNNEQYEYTVQAYSDFKKIDGTVVKSLESYAIIGTVGVKMKAPLDLIATPKDGSIALSWNAVQGADGYQVWGWKDKTPIPTEPLAEREPTNYEHKNLNNDDIYNYYIVPYKIINGIPDYGPQSETVRVKVGIALGTPQDLKTTTKDGEITVTWTPVSGATGYKLHYKNVTNGTSGEFDITKPPFTHTGLKNGDVYEYEVTPYKMMPGTGEIIPGPKSLTVTQVVGAVLDAPKDFTVTVNDGKVDMKWSAVQGAEGYIIHASSGGRYYQFDVSKVTYAHTDLNNGDVWTYYVTAYKTVNGSRTYSSPSESKTVTIGVSLNSAVDLTATAGNRQIDLTWTAVNGADGYVVYLYNSSTMEFEPITVTSKTTYSHVGLKNGKQYTYMVAPYKNINGKRYYGDYSISVTAIPTTGSITDMDHELIVKGTAPYGISHSEYITAVSNHGAFDESVDVYFSTNREATQEVRDVLKNYADGLSSFIIYPFDISIYRENTYIEVDPEDGYTVTVTMPVPDRLIAYRDYITVVHIGDVRDDVEQISLAEDWYSNYDQRLEVLPCAIVDIDNVWCVQFKCSSFSPYALVIYKEHIQDIASGGGLLDDGFTDTFNSGLLLFTALPDIMPHNRKLRIVQSGSKRYRVKSITKR